VLIAGNCPLTPPATLPANCCLAVLKPLRGGGDAHGAPGPDGWRSGMEDGNAHSPEPSCARGSALLLPEEAPGIPVAGSGTVSFEGEASRPDGQVRSAHIAGNAHSTRPFDVAVVALNLGFQPEKPVLAGRAIGPAAR